MACTLRVALDDSPTLTRGFVCSHQVKLLQKLRHPFVVAYHDAFVHKNRDLCIVMERCEGGDLQNKAQNEMRN